VGPSKKYFSGVSAYTICLANALSLTNSVSALMMRNLLPRFLYPGKKNVGREDYSLEFTSGIRVFEGMDWNSPLSWIKAYRFLKREKPDVIIIPWWTSAVAHMELFLAVVNALSVRAKLILEMHEIVDPLEAGKPVLRLYSRIMGRLIMNRAGAFVVHSDTVKNQAIEAYHLKKDKVFIIPHGVYNSYLQTCTQDSARKELGINEKFVVLYFGMIRKYKGVPCLVQAFNQLSPEIASESRLIIAGEDWGDEEGLESIIKNSPYSNNITLKAEFVADSEVPKYFSAADVVALPYLRSAGSGVASLAMAFGKPIIISDLENIKESLQDYKGTMLVPCGNASNLAEKISEVYARRQAGKVVNYAIPSSCGWDNVTELFQNVITQISKTRENNQGNNQ
jgi:glycosyltransferase involved in cell wall biosynthesis